MLLFSSLKQFNIFLIYVYGYWQYVYLIYYLLMIFCIQNSEDTHVNITNTSPKVLHHLTLSQYILFYLVKLSTSFCFSLCADLLKRLKQT